MHEVTGINQAENRPVSIQLEFEVYRIGIRHHDIQDILTIKLLEFIPMVMEQDGNAIGLRQALPACSEIRIVSAADPWNQR